MCPLPISRKRRRNDGNAIYETGPKHKIGPLFFCLQGNLDCATLVGNDCARPIAVYTNILGDLTHRLRFTTANRCIARRSVRRRQLQRVISHSSRFRKIPVLHNPHCRHIVRRSVFRSSHHQIIPFPHLLSSPSLCAIFYVPPDNSFVYR